MTLAEAPVGTEVILSCGRNCETVTKINRRTSTMIVVEDMRFRPDTGFEKKKRERWDWNYNWIRIPIEGEAEQVRSKLRRESIIHKLGSTEWKNISSEHLEQIYAILIHPPQ